MGLRSTTNAESQLIGFFNSQGMYDEAASLGAAIQDAAEVPHEAIRAIRIPFDIVGDDDEVYASGVLLQFVPESQVDSATASLIQEVQGAHAAAGILDYVQGPGFKEAAGTAQTGIHRYAALRAEGSGRLASAFLAWIGAVGDVVGVTPASEAIVGAGLDTGGREIDSIERTSRGLRGFGQLTLTVAGSIGPRSPAGITKNKLSGDSARDFIAGREGGSIEVGLGGRRYDVGLRSQGRYWESKVGYQKLGRRTAKDKRIRQEVARDYWNLKMGRANEITWEFFRSATTGEIGFAPQLGGILGRIQSQGLNLRIRINPGAGGF